MRGLKPYSQVRSVESTYQVLRRTVQKVHTVLKLLHRDIIAPLTQPSQCLNKRKKKVWPPADPVPIIQVTSPAHFIARQIYTNVSICMGLEGFYVLQPLRYDQRRLENHAVVCAGEDSEDAIFLSRYMPSLLMMIYVETS